MHLMHRLKLYNARMVLPAHPPCRSLMPVAEFESPDAADTTVLVTGATGRVGRVLVRKLLLRGYKVRALVRQREAGGEAGSGGSSEKEVGGGISGSSSSSSADTEAIPQSAELVFGDVGDYKACRRAVEGVDKVGGCSGRCGAIKHNAGITWQGTLRHFDANLRSLPASLLVGFLPALKHSPPPCTLLPARLQVICCSAARSTITADLSRVEEKGVANLAAAFQDAQNAAARQQGRLSAAAKREVVDFADANYHEAWDITAVGVPAQGEQLRASWLPEPAANRFLGPISLVPRSTPCLSGPKATCLLASLSPQAFFPAPSLIPNPSPPCPPAEESADGKTKARRRAAERMRARDNAECYINDDDNLVFEGTHALNTCPLTVLAGWLVGGSGGLVGGSAWLPFYYMPQHPLPSGTLPLLPVAPLQARCTPATAWPRWAPSWR